MKTQIEEYLNKCGQHLFQDKNGNLYSVTSAEKDGVLHAVSFTFGKKEISIRTIDIDKLISWNGKNSRCFAKHTLFPDYNKREAIRHFKAFKNLQIDIGEYCLRSDYIIFDKDIQNAINGIYLKYKAEESVEVVE